MNEENSITPIEIEYARLKEKYAELLIKNDYLEQYFTAMVWGSTFSYEIDVTKDKIISIPDSMIEAFNIHINSSYTALLEIVCKNLLSESEREIVLEKVSRDSILKAYADGERQISIEYLAKDGTNNICWYRNRLYLLQHPVSGNITAIITITDIQKQKVAELKMRERAQRDPLTHLFNRGFLEEQISLILQNNVDNHCAFLLDIDDFKKINDTFGHQAGDDVLSAFAKMLLSKFRRDDIVARLGGDEFFIFMSDAKPSIAKIRAQAIIDACKTLMPPESNIVVTPSIGVSIYPNDGSNFEDLYRNADIALYVSKQKGKNSFTIYNSSLKK